MRPTRHTNERDLTTVARSVRRPHRSRRRLPGLTVLCHPDPAHVGHRAALSLTAGGPTLEVSRVQPTFLSIDGDSLHALDDPHLSRQAAFRLRRAGELLLEPGVGSLEVDGEPVTTSVALSSERLAGGVLILIADRVALLLHEMVVPPAEPLPGSGLLGVSAAMVEVQQEIERVRDLDVPILLRGETGTGKELTARAIHGNDRRKGPFVAVNMASLPPSLAAAELFGATRGAFTGAEKARQGLFREASGGTLFLDEIGLTPPEVQVHLLRFLEDHVVRSLGASRGEKVDVRVVAATDSDLDRAIEAGDFSRALLQRLGGYQIELPPLRERPDDLGILFHHFLATELRSLRKGRLLSDPGPGKLPWLPADLFRAFVRYRWPGNVRELRNVARRIAIRYHDSEVDIDGVCEFLDAQSFDAEDAPANQHARPRRSYRSPSEITAEDLESTLRECRYSLSRAAGVLGISRPSLYNLIDRHPSLRTAAELGRNEIDQAATRCAGDIDQMAEDLRVSRAALQARLRALASRDT